MARKKKIIVQKEIVDETVETLVDETVETLVDETVETPIEEPTETPAKEPVVEVKQPKKKIVKLFGRFPISIS